MQRSGKADLKLMGGRIPSWLYDRMVKLSLPIVETILMEYGKKAFLSKLSNPHWFQSFGAVIGMDWNSSGVTTAVMRALNDAIQPVSKELGIYICGGKGRESRRTPQQLLEVGDLTGLDGQLLAKASRLSAKVDSNAVQDGFQIYMHYFVVNDQGDWSVIQQGMQGETGKARRYHWHSQGISTFTQEPHSAVCGEHQGEILNLVHRDASSTQQAILGLTQEKVSNIIMEIPHMKLPDYYGVKAKDVDLKRLGSILYLAQENEVENFDELVALKGLGPRTLQSLTLVSEVLHGTPSRFNDPARFSFAHGGKGGSPFPVPTHIYDEVTEELKQAINRTKWGDRDKMDAIKKLHNLAERMEKGFQPNKRFEEYIEKEKEDAKKYGGRTIFDSE